MGGEEGGASSVAPAATPAAPHGLQRTASQTSVAGHAEAGDDRREELTPLLQQRRSSSSGNLHGHVSSRGRSSISLRSVRHSSLAQPRRATVPLGSPADGARDRTRAYWPIEEVGALLLRGLGRGPAAPQFVYVVPSLAEQSTAAKWIQRAVRHWHARHHDPAAERAVLHISISSERSRIEPQTRPWTRPRPQARPCPNSPLALPPHSPHLDHAPRLGPRPEAGLQPAQQGVPRPLRPLLPVHALGPVHQRRAAHQGVQLQPAAALGRGLPPAHPARGRARAAHRSARRRMHACACACACACARACARACALHACMCICIACMHVHMHCMHVYM